jgi:hypothetical protein
MTSDTHAAGPVDQGEWPQTKPGERRRVVVSHLGDSTPMHHQNEDKHCLVPEVLHASCAATGRPPSFA